MNFGPITLDHIGIATESLVNDSPFWTLIGLTQGADDERVEDQGVTTRFFATDEGQQRPLRKSNFSNPPAPIRRLDDFLNVEAQGPAGVFPCWRSRRHDSAPHGQRRSHDR